MVRYGMRWSRYRFVLPGAVLAAIFALPLAAQDWTQGRWGRPAVAPLLPLFDADGNGRLDREERLAARAHLWKLGNGGAAHSAAWTGSPARPPTTREEDLAASRLAAAPDGKDLYDESVLRTLMRDWLDMKNLGPVIEDYRALIRDSLEADTKKLPSRWNSPPDIEAFIGERREFLLGHPALFPEGRL